MLSYIEQVISVVNDLKVESDRVSNSRLPHIGRPAVFLRAKRGMTNVFPEVLDLFIKSFLSLFRKLPQRTSDIFRVFELHSSFDSRDARSSLTVLNGP